MLEKKDRNQFYIDETVLKKIRNGRNYAYEIYEAEHTEVVLGRAAGLEEDVFTLNCKMDRVPIFRRLGGGGTVVLTRGMIIISLAGRSAVDFHLREHLNAVNQIVLKILESLNIKWLAIKGISDIALMDKKILGSSLYRKKELVLYQGSLLVCPNLTVIKRYLKHPMKEPDYRIGRSHDEFLTSLHKEGYRVDIKLLIERLKKEFSKYSPWPPLNASRKKHEIPP